MKEQILIVVAIGSPLLFVGVAALLAYKVIWHDADGFLKARGWRKLGKRTYRKGALIASQRKALKVERGERTR